MTSRLMAIMRTQLDRIQAQILQIGRKKNITITAHQTLLTAYNIPTMLTFFRKLLTELNLYP